MPPRLAEEPRRGEEAIRGGARPGKDPDDHHEDHDDEVRHD
jgi:hypothetical protein